MMNMATNFRLVFLICCLVLLPGCRGASKQASADVASVRIAPPTVVEHFKAQEYKKVAEFVEINGERYRIPSPWAGRKVQEPPPSPSAMKKIPLEFARKQMELYIHREACNAFIVMAEAALLDDVQLLVNSGFRSKWYQEKIFKKLMAEGRTWEDMVRYVAPPGYSEHMLGTAVDFFPSNWRFASTEQYEWLRKNAASFGFIERYPERSSEGFPWESWHWKYVGGERDRVISEKAVAEYIDSQQEQ